MIRTMVLHVSLILLFENRVPTKENHWRSFILLHHFDFISKFSVLCLFYSFATVEVHRQPVCCLDSKTYAALSNLAMFWSEFCPRIVYKVNNFSLRKSPSDTERIQFHVFFAIRFVFKQFSESRGKVMMVMALTIYVNGLFVTLTTHHQIHMRYSAVEIIVLSSRDTQQFEFQS